MPRSPKNRSGTQVIWNQARCDGELTWQGAMYSRRKLVCTAILGFDNEKPDRLWLEELETVYQYRNHGFATLMMQSIINMFRDEYKEIQLVIRPFGNNSISVPMLTNFYQKAGFRQTEDTKAKFPIWRLYF
jgi:GNAT superfamily N-acetyltransferase